MKREPKKQSSIAKTSAYQTEDSPHAHLYYLLTFLWTEIKVASRQGGGGGGGGEGGIKG